MAFRSSLPMVPCESTNACPRTRNIVHFTDPRQCRGHCHRETVHTVYLARRRRPNLGHNPDQNLDVSSLQLPSTLAHDIHIASLTKLPPLQDDRSEPRHNLRLPTSPPTALPKTAPPPLLPPLEIQRRPQRHGAIILAAEAQRASRARCGARVSKRAQGAVERAR